jgi:PKD repeat protein
VIGAFKDDDKGTESGSVYVFVRSGSTWNEQVKLTASDAAVGDRFGGSVSISSNTVIVGAWLDDNSRGTDAGSAYVYELMPPNSPPTITSITGPIDPIPVGTTFNMQGTFTDPDSGDTHTATWDWGDNTETPGVVTGGSVTGQYAYSTPGVYAITLTVEDAAGESDTATYQQYVVVYDPTGAFITGGGWINSPPGAIPEQPEIIGKASFGFISKYHHGAITPGGNTQFKFKYNSTQQATIGWLLQEQKPNSKEPEQ